MPEHPQRESLGKTKDGIEVFFDPHLSHASTHFAHQPQLRSAVEKVIPTLEANSDLVRVDRNMEEIIGNTDLVETSDSDEIVYALRPKRTVYSRFVKGKSSVPTSWITVVLRKKGNIYILYTAFVGRNVPSFPGGDYLPEQSREFWSTHALVWGSQEIIPGTETTVCPW